MKTLTKFVVFSFAALIGYTIVSQIIGYVKGLELSTLTTCFFSAFGGEVLLCALLKMLKLKGDQNANNSNVASGMQCGDYTGGGGDQNNVSPDEIQ